MSLIETEFEWPVSDAGYRIIDPRKSAGKGKSPKKSKSPLTGKEATLITGDINVPYIEPVPGPAYPKRPLEICHTLFMIFASLDGSNRSIIEFANIWGMLEVDSVLPSPKEPKETPAELLFVWKDQIKEMKKTVDWWQSDIPKMVAGGKFGPIANLSAYLVEAPIGQWKLKIIPNSLLSGMWLQLAQAISTKRTIKSCKWCGDWFETGQGTDRRTGALFCSDQHRAHHHNKRQAKDRAKGVGK